MRLCCRGCALRDLLGGVVEALREFLRIALGRGQQGDFTVDGVQQRLFGFVAVG